MDIALFITSQSSIDNIRKLKMVQIQAIRELGQSHYELNLYIPVVTFFFFYKELPDRNKKQI